jgi:hypothetical protein
MTGISRIHGGVTSETLHGGYQMTILKIESLIFKKQTWFLAGNPKLAEKKVF